MKRRHLEREVRFQLDQPGRCIAAEERAEDRGWGVHRVLNDAITARTILHVILGLSEIWMVEYVEELHSEI